VRRAVAFAVGFGAFLTGGCEALEPAYRLERPRILGARLVVVAEPARASVRPGEAVVLETFTGSREKDRGAFVAAAFTVCPAEDDTIEARCAGARFADTAVRGAEDPRLPFTIPADFRGKMLAFAMFCQEGDPAIEPTALRGTCSRGAGQEMVLRFEVGGEEHLHPRLGADAIGLDGAPLPERRGGCSDGARVVRADGKSHELTFDVAGVEAGEEPIVSHVVTYGKLEGLYSNAGADGRFRVGWEIPGDFTEPRIDARIHVVVRDGRGGAAVRVADVCLEKGATP